MAPLKSKAKPASACTLEDFGGHERVCHAAHNPTPANELDRPYSMNRANRRARKLRVPLGGYERFPYYGVKALLHTYAGRLTPAKKPGA